MIEYSHVGKTYASLFGRPVRAVEDFSLRVSAGEVLGIAGPNGAGKSTLLALLLGYLHPTAGTVRIDGLEPRRYVERYGIAYLSELIALNPRWRLQAALTRLGILAGIPAAKLAARVDTVIETLGLGEHRRKKLKALSKGTLQRLGLAQAMLTERQVVVLDEPTHGLDPVWTQRFRELVASQRRPERAIIIASHNLDELQRVADRVAIIDRGVLQRTVETRTLGTFAASAYLITTSAPAEQFRMVFPGAVDIGYGTYEVRVHDLAELNRALGELIARGVLISAVAPATSALESQFREVVGEAS